MPINYEKTAYDTAFLLQRTAYTGLGSGVHPIPKYINAFQPLARHKMHIYIYWVKTGIT